jgi:hypothetical protein
MFQIFLPVAVVHAFSIVVNSFALLFVKSPVTIVVVIRAVLVFALALLFTVLKVAFIGWGF